jgi:signal transduction histidine kinase
VGELALTTLRSIADHVEEIDRLQSQTVRLIRRVQAMVRLTDQFENELIEIRRLFENNGDVSQIGLVLLDLVSGLQEIDRDIRKMQELANLYGGRVPKAVLDEELGLLGKLSDHVIAFQDLVAHMVELLKLLREVGDGLKGVPSGAIDLHQPLAKKKIRAVMGRRIRVEVSLEREPGPILGIPIHLWQVVLNLTRNAREAMKGVQGHRSLLVATRRISLSYEEAASLQADLIRPAAVAGEFMILRIQDTGPGIPADVLPHIFDVSFSGKGSSGLGLSVVLKIIRDLGGFITVETSTEGATGTTFSLYFPRSHSVA